MNRTSEEQKKRYRLATRIASIVQSLALIELKDEKRKYLFCFDISSAGNNLCFRIYENITMDAVIIKDIYNLARREENEVTVFIDQVKALILKYSKLNK